LNKYFTVLKKYVDFKGRARRNEFWIFTLLNAIFLFFTMILDYVIGTNISPLPFGAVFIVYALLVFLPFLAVLVRRMHDIGKSGWYIFISLIPIAGAVWLLSLCITEGTVGENVYGIDPIVASIPEG
jgi:uncharacterized membrane protein YhaH (DUF805 family)